MDRQFRTPDADGASLTEALAVADIPSSGDLNDVKPVIISPTVNISTIARMVSGLRFMATISGAFKQ